MFLFCGLENKVGEAREQEVTDEGRKIDVQIAAIIFELLRGLDYPEVGVTMQKLFKVFPPGKLSAFRHLLGPHFFLFEINA
jgi:hypothetical protein